MHAQRPRRSLPLRPPAKASFGETLGRQPKPLPVIDQHFYRGRSAAAEYEQASRKRIGIELGAAQLGQRVDTLAEVDGLHRHQYPHLRREGQHDLRRGNARISSASWLVAMVFRSSRSFPPLADSTSTTQLVAVAVLAASSSIKAGAALSSRRWRRIDFGDFAEARGSNRSVHF